MQVYFGERWDAPAFDDAREIPVPVGRTCLFCEEPIAEDDSGTMMLALHADGSNTVEAVHIECHLRSVLGDIFHLREECSCYGGAGHDERPYREAARDVMRYWKERRGA